MPSPEDDAELQKLESEFQTYLRGWAKNRGELLAELRALEKVGGNAARLSVFIAIVLAVLHWLELGMAPSNPRIKKLASVLVGGLAILVFALFNVSTVLYSKNFRRRPGVVLATVVGGTAGV
jgi:hypothetical protein